MTQIDAFFHKGPCINYVDIQGGGVFTKCQKSLIQQNAAFNFYFYKIESRIYSGILSVILKKQFYENKDLHHGPMVNICFTLQTLNKLFISFKLKCISVNHSMNSESYQLFCM